MAQDLRDKTNDPLHHIEGRFRAQNGAGDGN